MVGKKSAFVYALCLQRGRVNLISFSTVIVYRFSRLVTSTEPAFK